MEAYAKLSVSIVKYCNNTNMCLHTSYAYAVFVDMPADMCKFVHGPSSFAVNMTFC
jgi:hypothetical protein